MALSSLCFEFRLGLEFYAANSNLVDVVRKLFLLAVKSYLSSAISLPFPFNVFYRTNSVIFESYRASFVSPMELERECDPDGGWRRKAEDRHSREDCSETSTPGEGQQGADGSLNQTGFLLQRLQDLKRWQAEQEERLLREQRLQMEDLKRQTADVGGKDEGEPVWNREEPALTVAVEDSLDDDPTIDQEISSLTSYEELPKSTSDAYYSSAFEEEEDATPRPPRLANDAAVPSWASRTESATTQEAKTVVAAARSKNLADNPDERVVGNAKSFEQMLAEQLGLDQDQVKREGEPAPQRSGERQARAFLRKGSGLARFGGVGGVAVTPVALRRMKRSKSQGSVRGQPAGRGMTASTSCSRLDIAERETIASASKRAQPKRSLSIKSVSSVSSLGSRKSPPCKESTSNGKASKSGGEKINTLPRTTSKSNNVKKASTVSPVATSPGVPLPKPTFSGVQTKEEDADVSPVHGIDSVEWSFREKLKKADKNHEVKWMKDLRL